MHLQNNLKSLMFKYLVLLCLLLLGSCFTEENGVLVLTQADFTVAVKQHDYLFVKLYTPWCGHCKKLVPIWIELAAELRSTLPEVRLAEADLDANKALQAQLKVQSYPTLLFFKNGVPINFKGSRTKESMISWLGKKIQQPIINIDQKRLATLETDGYVNIVFYGPQDTPEYNTLLTIAKNDDYNMYYRVDSSSRPAGSVQIFRPFGATVTLEKVDFSVRSWINLNDRPVVYEYDDRTTKELYTEKRNGILLFAAVADSPIVTAFNEAAVEWRLVQKKKLMFIQIGANSESYTGLSDHIKVNPATNPIVYTKAAEKVKYVYSGKPSEVTGAKIIEFIKNVESGKIRKWKMEEQTKPKTAQSATAGAKTPTPPKTEL